MTAGDFESIANSGDVAYGRVHIELQPFGFCVIKRQRVGDQVREVRRMIGYEDAFCAREPVDLFAAVIDRVNCEMAAA